MVFSSAIFLFFFLPIVLILYFLLPKKGQNWLLLISSILFYTWGEPRFILILLASITIDFFIAKSMANQEGKKRKTLLIISIILNLGLLGYFKYANFFIDNIQQLYHLFGLNPFEWSKVALPVGISFVTFQKISYMVDVYRKTDEPQKNWTLLTLYILMFPQLIAGPIVRYKEIAQQLENRGSNLQDRLNGIFRFLIGLSKKVLIANVLAAQVDTIFAITPAELSTGTAWIGMIAYSLQIYFDFSGYSDMALGLGKIFGFTFPENFNFPYISKSFTEFWRRWHISLCSWMKDYLYIPLGGNRVKVSRMYLNLLIVFLLSGLWHGAAWTFIAWGLYHGLFLVADKLFLKKFLQKIGNAPALILTFIFVMIGWVIFRSDNLTYAGQYIKQLFVFQQFSDVVYCNTRFIVILIFALLCSFIGVFGKIETLVNRLFYIDHTNLQLILFSFLSAILYVLSSGSLLAGGFNPFIYFRF